MADLEHLRPDTAYRDRVVASSESGDAAAEGSFRTKAAAVSGGGDWRQLRSEPAGALLQKLSVERAPDGADGRKALVWSVGGRELGRLRASDGEWLAMFELLGLGK